MKLGFGRALSLAGCGRVAVMGGALLVALGSGTPQSRWAAVPVDIESVSTADPASVLRADLEALLQGPRWTVESRSRVARAIDEESRAAGLDPLLVMALVLVESDANGAAVSNRGAIGLMQLRPPTMRFIAETEGVGLPPGDAVLADPAL
ncbi:MAG: transglycosylase SLT domain-containing protein, partial [Deltaproteobacteria bacterium]